MKRALALLLLPMMLCACIGDSANSPPEVVDSHPAEGTIRILPYEDVTFSILATDADSDDLYIRWYIDNEFLQESEELEHSFNLEKEYEVRGVVDDGEFNVPEVWNIVVEIDTLLIMEQMSEIRMMEFTEQVPFRMITREELDEMLQEDFSEEENELMTEEKVLRAFHVWDEASLLENVVRMYTLGVEGYYDLIEKEFVLVDEPSKNPAVRMVTIAHELTHVLQDQNYDTLSLLETENDDEYIALTSLFEGDATYFESYYLYDMADDAIADYFTYYNSMADIIVAPLVSDLVMFPYIYGFKFVSKVIGDHDVDYLDTVFQDPPKTTEQILHPEKYYSGELGKTMEPIDVQDMELIDENILGESNIFIFLDQHLETYIAKKAAQGWNGDIYSYYENDNGHLLAFISSWDSPQDASEFVDTYIEFIYAIPWEEYELTESYDGIYLFDSPSGFIKVQLVDDEVSIFSGTDIGLLDYVE